MKAVLQCVADSQKVYIWGISFLNSQIQQDKKSITHFIGIMLFVF